jgi:UDP-N-acetylmuramyl pentapeptide synthase
VARRLSQELRRGDWLLVKGSRGMKMEKVLQELKSAKA